MRRSLATGAAGCQGPRLRRYTGEADMSEAERPLARADLDEFVRQIIAGISAKFAEVQRELREEIAGLRESSEQGAS